MSRHFKNSDDNTFYRDKAIDSKLEKLRFECIPGYTGRKGYNNNNKTKKNYGKKPYKK